MEPAFTYSIRRMLVFGFIRAASVMIQAKRAILMFRPRGCVGLSLLLIFPAGMNLIAADHVAITESPGDWSGGASIVAPFDAAQADLQKGSFDPRAKDLLAASERFTKQVFRVPSLERRSTITYRDVWGDNLLAEWSFHEPFAEGTAIHRDTPFNSTFLMKLATDSWRTKGGLRDLLTALIDWNNNPGRLGYVALRLSPGYPSPPRFLMLGPVVSELAFLHDFNGQGAASEGSLYLSMRVGKSFTRGIYPIGPYIPERFPSLRELAASWDDNQIFRELGKPNDRDFNGNPVVVDNDSRRFGDFTDARDGVLVDELVRRDYNEANLIHLLTNGTPQRLWRRAILVFQAMQDAGKISDFDRYFQSILAGYQGVGPAADGAVAEMFRVLARRKKCGREFEESAFDLLRRGTVQFSALGHISDCSASPEALRMLESTPVSDQLANDKEWAVAQIRRRLGH